jgi:hypothetical protein
VSGTFGKYVPGTALLNFVVGVPDPNVVATSLFQFFGTLDAQYRLIGVVTDGSGGNSPVFSNHHCSYRARGALE